MPTWMKITTEARKLGAAIFGLSAVLLANDLLPEPYAHWVALSLAVATATGVYRAENTPKEN